MKHNRRSKHPVLRLLENGRVRSVTDEQAQRYAAVDVVAVLSDSAHAGELWEGLKQREPALERLAQSREVDGQVLDLLDLTGVVRLVQAIPSRKAERLKMAIARNIDRQVREMDDPELAKANLRKMYERRGYTPQWARRRVGGMDTRRELTREWARRGVRESEEYRQLTNLLIEQAFGMDVEAFRRYKGLFGTARALRDHMSGIELVLTMLGEVAAVQLHRERGSEGFEALLRDVKDAGEIVARTRQDLQTRIVKHAPGRAA